jgi:hypothetical protein
MTPIHEIIKKIISDNISNKKFLFSYIQVMWKYIIGEKIASETKVSDLNEKELIVVVYDDELLKVLSKLNFEIAQKIEGILGKDIVKNIIFKRGKRKSNVKKGSMNRQERAEKVEAEPIIQSEFIKDDELRQLFNKAYAQYMKITKLSED